MGKEKRTSEDHVNDGDNIWVRKRLEELDLAKCCKGYLHQSESRREEIRNKIV